MDNFLHQCNQLYGHLYDETCYPHTKIAKFVNAAKHRFASPIGNPTKGKKSQTTVQKMVHNPNNRQPHHTVNSSNKMGTTDNRQSCQPIAINCKDRSPTSHPHRCENTAHSSINRGREDTRQSCQPTAISCRNMNPTPHPHEHGNTCGRTLPKSINKSLQMDINSFQIDTIQVHKNSPYSTEIHPYMTISGAFQDHLPAITQNHLTSPYSPKVCYKTIPETIRTSHKYATKESTAYQFLNAGKNTSSKPPQWTILTTLQHH